ncbi:MAG: efflux RND transporter periplasmic adaptor subunit, partial [Lentisphaeria bacterium]|nr:efflux RND transporter periplasmic adaptor subunit [Lentisphaeria bacterium]
VQLDPIRVTFSISNRDFLELFGTEANFRENASITIRMADGTVYDQQGSFEFMNNEANRKTDTLAFYVSFPNPDRKLVPGSSVTVLLHKNLSENYTAVLPSAIMADNASPYVWVLADDNTAHRRNVVLGPSDGEVQLISSGLSAGEMVIIEGTHKVMMDGMAVKPLIRQ